VPRGAVLVGHVGDERDLPRPLDRGLQLPLVLGAGPRDPARQDLAALGHERPDQLDVLVVDVVDLVRAELADLAAAEQCAPLPFFSSSTRTTMWRMTRSITLSRRSSSFISSPLPLTTCRT